MGCLKEFSTAEHFQFQGTFPVWIVGFVSISIIPLKANIRPYMEYMECATCGFFLREKSLLMKMIKRARTARFSANVRKITSDAERVRCVSLK